MKVKRLVIGLIILAATGAAIAALLLQLGVISLADRWWMGEGRADSSIFARIAGQLGIRLVDATGGTGYRDLNLLIIRSGLDLYELDTLVSGMDRQNIPAVAVLFPQIRELKPGPSRSLPLLIDRSMTLYRLQASWMNRAGEIFPLPGEGLLAFSGEDRPVGGVYDAGSLFSFLGSYRGIQVYACRIPDLIQNRHMAVRSSAHLLYEGLLAIEARSSESGVHDDLLSGTWGMYDSELHSARRNAARNPLAVLFNPELLPLSTALIMLLLLMMLRAGIRFGPPLPPPVPEVRMIEAHVHNTTLFWQAHGGLRAADLADRDRFLREIKELGANSGEPDGTKETPDISKELIEYGSATLNRSRLNLRIRSRDEIIQKMKGGDT